MTVPPHSTAAKIPKGSVLTTPVAKPYIGGLTDLDHVYLVPMKPSATESYLLRHLAPGARVASIGGNCVAGKSDVTLLESVPVSGTHEYSASLELGLAADGSRTLLRVDAETSWVSTRSKSESAPAGTPLTLTVYAQGGPAGPGTSSTSVPAADAAQVTSMLNTLPLAPSVQCAESAPRYQLQWGAGTSAFVATGYSCGGMVSVGSGGKAASPLLDRSARLVALLNGFHLSSVPPISYAGTRPTGQAGSHCRSRRASTSRCPHAGRCRRSIAASSRPPRPSSGSGSMATRPSAPTAWSRTAP